MAKNDYKRSRNNSELCGRICGVPQCRSYNQLGISIHKIPAHVMQNKEQLARWKSALKMEDELPKQFLICSAHFNKKHVLVPATRNNIACKSRLASNAFPTENLPTLSFRVYGFSQQKSKRLKTTMSPQNIPNNSFQKEKSSGNDTASVIEKLDNLPFELESDDKLYSMTGIPNFLLLTKIVEACLSIRPDDANNRKNLENRIILTMFRIKTNLGNVQTAILFGISEQTADNCFIDCVQLLAKALKSFIYWQSHGENYKRLPKSFTLFSNTMTVINCITIKTIQFRCGTCRTCTFSQCKGMSRVKILIGVAPYGHINFIDTNFDLSNLMGNLMRGDAVMFDNGLVIGDADDELEQAGVVVIRSSGMSQCRENDDGTSDCLIAEARKHVETRMSQIKMFKMVSEKMYPSILTYLHDVITIICSISNLSLPPMSDANKIT